MTSAAAMASSKVPLFGAAIRRRSAIRAFAPNSAPAVITGDKSRRGKKHVIDSPSQTEKVRGKKNNRVGIGKLEKRPNATADCGLVLDYDEVAAALENLYKLSPAEVSIPEEEEREGNDTPITVVRSNSSRRRARRIKLEETAELSGETMSTVTPAGKGDEYEARLVREHSMLADMASLDWKKVKIPPVLSSSEHSRLFKLMQPLKAIVETKGNLCRDLSREPTDAELAAAVKMTVRQLRRHLHIGRAARNKLIKHNLRLVLFVINKHYGEMASGHKLDDLCQAGVKGLITAIDRFEPKRGFRLSTYGLFWIRHSVIRSMTTSSFTKFPFAIESERQVVQKAKLELSFELGRQPTEQEIVERTRISSGRFHDILRAAKPVLSLNARHVVTQEEYIDGITDVESSGGGDKQRQPALLRLALDDVLDSLRPKESLVIRQRYGLDGKGERTLGEIAGNLNISREMVRKHELKALIKLKHPTRVDYLRRYI